MVKISWGVFNSWSISNSTRLKGLFKTLNPSLEAHGARSMLQGKRTLIFLGLRIQVISSPSLLVSKAKFNGKQVVEI